MLYLAAALATVGIVGPAGAGPAGLRARDVGAGHERPVDLEQAQRLHDARLAQRRRALQERYRLAAKPPSAVDRSDGPALELSRRAPKRGVQGRALP